VPNNADMHNKKACAINYLAESSQAKFLFTIFAHIIIIFALIKKACFHAKWVKKGRFRCSTGLF